MRFSQSTPHHSSLQFPHCYIAWHTIGEASIAAAVCSPHWKEAFVACEYFLEHIKLGVLTQKKEVYESEEPWWKVSLFAFQVISSMDLP
jgi:hypothetical protein